jgi:hypothetical protein
MEACRRVISLVLMVLKHSFISDSAFIENALTAELSSCLVMIELIWKVLSLHVPFMLPIKVGTHL